MAGPPSSGLAAAPRRSTPRRTWFVIAVLILGLVPFLFPMLWMVFTSLKSPAETRDPLLLLPAVWNWSNYPDALAQLRFGTTLANTIVIAVGCVIGQVLSCSLVGYGFARFRFPGRNALFVIMLATMMLPPQVTMVPVFVLFRSLGLVDSLASLIVPAWFGSPFFIFMFRQFFARVPEAVLEAARIDGASRWTVYWQIMMPLSWPVVAIVALYTFLGAWNDFMGPLIYLNSPEQATLSQALAGFSSQYGNTQLHLLMAANLVIMLPCVALFFAAQRWIMDAEFSGAVKG